MYLNIEGMFMGKEVGTWILEYLNRGSALDVILFTGSVCLTFNIYIVFTQTWLQCFND
jgi:hypothetical protein